MTVTDSSRSSNGCTLAAIGFDFQSRTETPLEPEKAADAIARDRCVWLDVDLGHRPDPDSLRYSEQLVAALGLLDEETLEDALDFETPACQTRHTQGLRFTMCGCSLKEGELHLEALNAFVGKNLLITVHRGPVTFLDEVKRTYHDDFVHHAQSFGFLIYELWDHLIENYLHTQRYFEEHVLDLQDRLMHKVDEDVFAAVSRLGSDLLRFRGLLLPARSALTELATRKSVFIPATTQPYLRDMTQAIEHILQDVMVDRDILSDTLNLNMSMMANRTNQVVSSLTAVSVIFLPLTFLCGVYGMNFLNLPELSWYYGYAMFWLVCAGIVGAGLYLLRKKRFM
ncbi:MAG: magnesium transporter CorA family protein [Planctomycetota bacterium]|jgi:magnesium transporter